MSIPIPASQWASFLASFVETHHDRLIALKAFGPAGGAHLLLRGRLDSIAVDGDTVIIAVTNPAGQVISRRLVVTAVMTEGQSLRIQLRAGGSMLLEV